MFLEFIGCLDHSDSSVTTHSTQCHSSTDDVTGQNASHTYYQPTHMAVFSTNLQQGRAGHSKKKVCVILCEPILRWNVSLPSTCRPCSAHIICGAGAGMFSTWPKTTTYLPHKHEVFSLSLCVHNTILSITLRIHDHDDQNEPWKFNCL